MNNTAGTDDETIAQRRKRLRRVSFADREITSVHIFKRDEDYETPPNPSAQNGEEAGTSESEDKVIRFFGELADSEDGEDEPVEKLFLRPKSSPSSGGSTIGSATSDDGKASTDFKFFTLNLNLEIEIDFCFPKQRTISSDLCLLILSTLGDYQTLQSLKNTMISPWTPQPFQCISVVLPRRSLEV